MEKDMTPDERKIESEKHASRREAAKNRILAARLDEERRQEIERYLAVQALAHSEERPRVGRHADEERGAQPNVWRRRFCASSPPHGRRFVDQLGHVDTERPGSP
jgi:hypothetical protein